MRRLTLAALLLASACGYRFVGAGRGLPEGIRAVHAPMFLNRTAEPGLEATFTQAFRQQLVRAKVNGTESSEAQVQGDVLSLATANTLLENARGNGYRLSSAVVLRLVKAGRVVSQVEVIGTEDFRQGGDILESEANRQAAVRRLAEAMMRDGYDRLASSW
jgi:hypothetical protein